MKKPKVQYAVKGGKPAHPSEPTDTAPPKPPKQTEFSKEVESAKEMTEDLVGGFALDDLDRVMLKNIALSPGISNVELAKGLNITPAKVGARRNKPTFQDALRILNMTTSDLLKEAALKGGRKLLELIDHWEPEIALSATKVALTPMLKTQVEVSIKPVTVFKTTVTPEGSLLQQMIDEDNAAREEMEKATAAPKLKPKRK